MLYQPPGRAIQVETGYGERLPSIDTRLPRNRDSDAIIEIVLQDSMEDSTVYNSAGEQTEKDVQGEELTGLQDAEGDRRSDSEYHDRFQRPFNGHRRELGSRRNPHAHEADGGMPFPLESPLHNDPNSKFQSPANPAESFGTRRLAEGPSRGEYSGTSAKPSKHSIPSRSPRENKHDDNQKARPGNNMEPNQASEPSPTELRTEHADDEHDDVLALGGDSIEIDDNETSDFRISEEAPGDDNSIHSSKKQKLSSRVEQTAIGDNGDDLRATQSDNSVAKSGSSNRKRRENSDEEVQDARSKKAGNARKHHEEEHTFRRKDDYGREDRHEMDKKHLGSKGREAVHHSYPYRDWESNSVRPFRGRNEGFERLREPNISFWQKRDHYGEAGSSNRSKIRVSDRNDKGNDARIEKRSDVVSSRRDNLVDGHQFKRKKDEEHSRRERTEREDSSHGYKAREDSSQRKGERDDNPGHRRRDKVEDHHSSKNKDESWCQKEREDRLWVKHPNEDPSLHRESRQNKSDSKILVSDKDCRHRDKRWHGERDSQHKGREDGHAREKKYANEERSLKHEMLDVHSTHSDSQKISRERDREKDAKGGTQNPLRLGKRKHEDHGARRNEKQVSSVSINQQESSKMEKQKEGDTASNDESQHKSKRGRSKMERWASHKGRDVEHNMNDIVPTDELPKIEGNIVSDSDDRDGHLDTVAKLKRRSERFKLPMPGEKDGAVSLNKRSENDTQLTQNEAPAADAEVKPERPARKRRWTNS